MPFERVFNKFMQSSPSAEDTWFFFSCSLHQTSLPNKALDWFVYVRSEIYVDFYFLLHAQTHTSPSQSSSHKKWRFCFYWRFFYIISESWPLTVSFLISLCDLSGHLTHEVTLHDYFGHVWSVSWRLKLSVTTSVCVALLTILLKLLFISLLSHFSKKKIKKNRKTL